MSRDADSHSSLRHWWGHCPADLARVTKFRAKFRAACQRETNCRRFVAAHGVFAFREILLLISPLRQLDEVKSMLKEWQFPQSSLWVDEKSCSLTWLGDEVMRTTCNNDHLDVNFGPTWFEFLSEGTLQDILSAAEEKLQQGSFARKKGKGKGKGGKEGRLSGMDWENDY